MVITTFNNETVAFQKWVEINAFRENPKSTIFKTFFNLGIGVLYVKAQEKDVNLFAFLSPFSTYVWILMIMAGVSVSIVMYLIARFVLNSPSHRYFKEMDQNCSNGHFLIEPFQFSPITVKSILNLRWSPYETEELNSEEGETPFASFHHCLWFSIASWVQQGCDFLPR